MQGRANVLDGSAAVKKATRLRALSDKLNLGHSARQLDVRRRLLVLLFRRVVHVNLNEGVPGLSRRPL